MVAGESDSTTKAHSLEHAFVKWKEEEWILLGGEQLSHKQACLCYLLKAAALLTYALIFVTLLTKLQL